jgi:hypothetical protein
MGRRFPRRVDGWHSGFSVSLLRNTLPLFLSLFLFLSLSLVLYVVVLRALRDLLDSHLRQVPGFEVTKNTKDHEGHKVGTLGHYASAVSIWRLLNKNVVFSLVLRALPDSNLRQVPGFEVTKNTKDHEGHKVGTLRHYASAVSIWRLLNKNVVFSVVLRALPIAT